MNLEKLEFEDKFEIILLEFEPLSLGLERKIENSDSLEAWKLYQHKSLPIILGTRIKKEALIVFIAPNHHLTIGVGRLFHSATFFTFRELVDIYRFIYQLHPTLN